MVSRIPILFLLAASLVAGCTGTGTGAVAVPASITIQYTPPPGFAQSSVEHDPPTQVYRDDRGDMITYIQKPHNRSRTVFFSEDTLRTMRGVYTAGDDGQVEGPRTARFMGTRWLLMNLSLQGANADRAMLFATVDNDTIHQFTLYTRSSAERKQYGAFAASIHSSRVVTR